MHLPVGNRIIDALLKTEHPLVLRRADIVTLSQGEPTTSHSRPMLTVDFPVSGTLLSIIGAVVDGSTAEVASVGTEGFVEVDAALRHTIAKRTSICQFAGEVIRIPLADFQEALVQNAPFADHVYHSVRTRIFLTEQLRICALRHATEQRLARWLLLAAYRTQLKELPATHDMLSGLLGTRRASVSIAAANLQKIGAISYARGIITIEDHKALRECACECYVVCSEALEEHA
jgi:CRP-like cAMP-binding protein